MLILSQSGPGAIVKKITFKKRVDFPLHVWYYNYRKRGEDKTMKSKVYEVIEKKMGYLFVRRIYGTKEQAEQFLTTINEEDRKNYSIRIV